MLTQANIGWAGPDKDEILVTNRAAATIAPGAVMMLDRRRADADSTTNAAGFTTAGVANAITPGAATTDQMVTETFGVAQTGAIDNKTFVMRLRGHCQLVNFSAQDAVVLATTRAVVTPSARTLTSVIGAQENSGTAAAVMRKVVFLPLTAVAASGQTEGYFDGINGFGTILFTTVA